MPFTYPAVASRAELGISGDRFFFFFFLKKFSICLQEEFRQLRWAGCEDECRTLEKKGESATEWKVTKSTRFLDRSVNYLFVSPRTSHIIVTTTNGEGEKKEEELTFAENRKRPFINLP